MNQEQRYAAVIRAAKDLERHPEYWIRTRYYFDEKRCLLAHLVGPANRRRMGAGYRPIAFKYGFTWPEVCAVERINDSSPSVQAMRRNVEAYFGTQ